QVLWLGLITICFTPGELPVVARFLSLSALAQEQNTVSPEQEGTITPRACFLASLYPKSSVFNGCIHGSRGREVLNSGRG
ncbi:hypothetical protein, partial [Moorena sp. SIO3I6]|uniref:hypothetical protein n=1 Tax=Moorena sp. SIO3I6 TaxID=2607831 RepID=UPI0025F66020